MESRRNAIVMQAEFLAMSREAVCSILKLRAVHSEKDELTGDVDIEPSLLRLWTRRKPAHHTSSIRPVAKYRRASPPTHLNWRPPAFAPGRV